MLLRSETNQEQKKEPSHIKQMKRSYHLGSKITNNKLYTQ